MTAVAGRLSGKVAVVTGGAGGLGRAIVERFTAEGAAVAIWDIGPGRAERAADHWGSDRVVGIDVDVADSSSVAAAAIATRAALGPIEILVNNAAIAGAAKPWAVSDEEWRAMMAVNIDGAYWCARELMADMRDRRAGKIINIASIAALRGSPETTPAYAASKGAMLGLTVSLARNLGEFGICVNAINPGFIPTEIHASFSEDQLAQYQADIPLHRGGVRGEHGTSADVAAAAAYLASNDADYVSGQFLGINGASRTG